MRLVRLPGGTQEERRVQHLPALTSLDGIRAEQNVDRRDGPLRVARLNLG